MNTNSQIQDLINRCAALDRNAQRELYILYADDLMSVAIRYARDLPAAKDLVHDAFMKIFQNINKFKSGTGSLQGWMTRILINEALQKIRREQKIVNAEEEEWAQQKNLDFSILDELEAGDILSLIQKLPEGCRVIFNMAVMEGFKHKEIADLLKITASASRAQLTRARKLLKNQLDKKKVKAVNS